MVIGSMYVTIARAINSGISHGDTIFTTSPKERLDAEDVYKRQVLNDETNALSGRQGTSGGLVFLFSLITCGIYALYWMYQMGNAVEMLHDQHGEPRGSAPVVYLLLSLFGLGIVAYALLQNELNKYLPNA